MIYTFGTTRSDYVFHHSDVFTAWHLADGLQAAGAPATVLWGGEDCSVNGVIHRNYKAAQLGPRDVLFCVTPQVGRLALGRPSLISAGTKWLWPYACTDREFNGRFDVIFVENAEIVKRAQALNPDSRVVWCMFGAPQHLPAAGDNPYPDGHNVFFAGRLMSQSTEGPCMFRLAQFGLVLQHLPDDYQMWIAAASVSIPPMCNGFRGNIPGEDYARKTIHAPLDYTGAPEWVNGERYMAPAALIDIVEAGLQNERIHFLGPLGYGTFWDRFRYADAALDFGFEGKAPGPNCKIVDPLRVGCPVVADGRSFSHYMIKDYDMGEVVAYRQPYAMAQAIERQAAKGRNRDECAARFVKSEGWHSRAVDILEATL